MQKDVLRFRKGATYKIKNRKTHNYLAIKMNEIDSTTEQQEENVWIIEQAQQRQFHIIDMKSAKALSLAQPNLSLKLLSLRNKETLWAIQQAQIIKEISYFWIKPLKEKTMSLRASSLNSKIKVDSIDQTLDIALWQFQQIDLKEEYYKGLSILKSFSTKLVLQVPQYSQKEGTSIIQAQDRGYGNQRWIIEQSDSQSGQQKQYIMRNFFSRLILTAHHSKFQNKITQQPFNNSINQKWVLQRIDSNIYMIQSLANKLLYLGAASEKEGSLALLTQEGPKTSWIIEGIDIMYQS